MNILLEVCVDSPQGLKAAIEGGARRIELCAALDLGGLTPTAGLIRAAAAVTVPVYVMIRPRPGNFIFDAADEAVMMADIDAVRGAGLAGVVIGANRADMRLDLPLLHRLKARGGGLGTTLHRAFDLVPDPDLALEEAVELGVERILTSGCEKTAVDGIETLRRISARAGGRLSIMPGSGVKPDNVARLVRETGVVEVHASCRAPSVSANASSIAFGFEPANSYHTDADVVRQMRRAIAEISRRS